MLRASRVLAPVSALSDGRAEHPPAPGRMLRNQRMFRGSAPRRATFRAAAPRRRSADHAGARSPGARTSLAGHGRPPGRGLAAEHRAASGWQRNIELRQAGCGTSSVSAAIAEHRLASGRPMLRASRVLPRFRLACDGLAEHPPAPGRGMLRNQRMLRGSGATSRATFRAAAPPRRGAEAPTDMGARSPGRVDVPRRASPGMDAPRPGAGWWSIELRQAGCGASSCVRLGAGIDLPQAVRMLRASRVLPRFRLPVTVVRNMHRLQAVGCSATSRYPRVRRRVRRHIPRWAAPSAPPRARCAAARRAETPRRRDAETPRRRPSAPPRRRPSAPLRRRAPR